MPQPAPRERAARARTPSRAVAVLLAIALGVIVLAALLAGSRWSALGLLPVIAGLGWLSAQTWPRLSRGQRLLRLVVLGALSTWVVLTLAAG
jgi:hypothetical protein